MKASAENDSLPVECLSFKLALFFYLTTLPQTILALCTLLRTSELASIVENAVVISLTSASFSLSKPRNTQFKGALKIFHFEAFPDKKKSIY